MKTVPLFRGAALALAITGGSAAHALDNSTLEDYNFAYTQGQALGPSCRVNMTFDTGGAITTGRLQVDLFVFGQGSHYAGGTYFFSILGTPGSVGHQGPITETLLATRCGLTNISNLVVDGLDTNWPSDGYYGFSFQANDPRNGQLSEYEFAFSGVTNTVAIHRVTPIDTTPPTVNLVGAPSGATSTAPFMLTADFSEDVSGFDATDINVTNASVTVAGGPEDYMITVTPTGAGDISLSIPAAVAQDAAGNDNTASSMLTIPYDTDPPTVTLTGGPAAANGTAPFDVTVDFSENVTGFDATDVDVTNASVTVSGGPEDYTLTVTPNGGGDISLSIPAAAAQDAAANDNTASSVLTVPLDVDAPTVTLTGGPSAANSTDPFTVTAEFSDEVAGFDASDVDVTNATVTVAGGPEDYILTVTPDGNGDVSLSIPAAAAQDTAGNDNLASAVLTVSYDDTAPTVTLSGGPTSVSTTDPFEVTATFSKAVAGFSASDVDVSHATVSMRGGPAVYTMTVTPDGNGDVMLSIPASVATDASGNDNQASNLFIAANMVVRDTQRAISGFMLNRANNLASNQPGLVDLLRTPGGGCGHITANTNGASGAVDGCLARGNVWAEITGAWSDASSYTLATVGAHGYVSPNLIVGGMLQFDDYDDDTYGAEGRGWLVGPYFVARLPGQPLYFEGRLLYGETHNEIGSDSFDTERMLAQFGVTGQIETPSITWLPSLGVIYIEDEQQAYTDSLGNPIPEQTVRLTQISAGIDFNAPIVVTNGSLTLTGGVSAIYSETDGSAGDTVTPEFEGGRGRVHLGLNRDLGPAGQITLSVFHDGIGQDYESQGVTLSWQVQF